MAQVPVFGDPQWIQQVQRPRCRECGTSTSKPAECFHCDEVICPKCVRFETWGGIPRKVCKSCREAGIAIDADIKHEEQAYCKCKFTDAHECAVAKRLPVSIPGGMYAPLRHWSRLVRPGKASQQPFCEPGLDHTLAKSLFSFTKRVYTITLLFERACQGR